MSRWCPFGGFFWGPSRRAPATTICGVGLSTCWPNDVSRPGQSYAVAAARSFIGSFQARGVDHGDGGVRTDFLGANGEGVDGPVDLARRGWPRQNPTCRFWKAAPALPCRNRILAFVGATRSD